MISTSSKWKTYSRDIGTFHIKAVLTKGATTLNLTDSDFMESSVGIADSISGMNSIELGAVVTNSFSATLNNFDGKFSNFNFAGATITVQFGIIYEDSTEEWINRGTYLVDKPMTYGNTISIECYDYMDKLNKFINGITGLSFPMTGKALIQAICTYCGVTFGAWDTNLNPGTIDVLTADMFDVSTTCRQVVGWILQTVGGYARINPTNNRLDCKQFGNGVWLGTLTYSGGTMSSWTTGTAYDGGTMSPWNTTTNYNGGLISDAAFSLSNIKTQSIYVDDFYITGVKVIPYNNEDENSYATAGSSGYVVTIESNPLISTSNANSVASAIWNGVSGLTVRPFSANIFGDPSYEAGDLVNITDTNGNTVKSIVTNLRYSLSGNMALSCDADSPQEITAEYADKYWYTNSKLSILEDSYHGEIEELRDDLESQIDGKIDTWVQSTAPSSSWTSADKTKHNGDLWYYTGTTNLTVNSVTIQPSKTYQYNASTDKWVAYNNPAESLFDFADGKSTIYYGSTSSVTTADEGDYLVDSVSGMTYKRENNAWTALIASPVVNLLPTTYYTERNSGAGAYTINGITWTLNKDGSITASGTATANSPYILAGSALTSNVPCLTLDPNQRYMLSGCPSGGGTYRVRARCTPAGTTPSTSTGSVVTDTGTGVLLPAGTKYAYVYCQVESGAVLSSAITFYPMLEVGTAKHNYVSTHADTTAQISSSIDSYDTELNQLKVFNKLTNNGALQGLYMDSGDMYVNATYIKTGTLSADRITSHSIPTSKLSGSVTNGNWGINFTNGTMSIGNLSANNITAGTITGAVEATNLTMTGGKVNLTTSSSTADIISLQYGTDIATMRGGHFEIRKSNSNTVRGELGVSSDTHAALKIYNANGKCVSNQGESQYGGGLQCNDTNEKVRCLLAPSSLGSGALMLYNASDARTVAIDAYSPAMQLFNSSGTNYTISLNGSNGAVFAASYNNTSSLDLKKNVKKAESMLSKIVDADILSFNYKSESKGAKSHIGLAIGGDYNVPEEVIAESDDGEQSGVDLYTMISMAWKAIQEQQEKIESLEKRVAELESKKESR